MRIRHATLDDVTTIINMGERFHSSTVYGDVAGLDRETVAETLVGLIGGRGAIFICENESAVVGMLGVLVTNPWFNRKIKVTLELFWWVDEDSRKSGAGRLLFNALQAWWPERSEALIMLRTPNIEPEKMDRLYRMKGFTPWDQTYMLKKG
jgi:GNAT superfamily N-acetyltransferase